MIKLIFDIEEAKNIGYKLPKTAIDEYTLDMDSKYLRNTELSLPKLNEFNVAIHFSGLLSYADNKNSVYTGEKYLCSIIDDMSRIDGFTGAHPYQLSDACQGAGELMFTLRHMFSDMFGMCNFTLQPTAKKGIFTALCIIKKHCRNIDKHGNIVLVSGKPDENTISEIKKFGYEAKTVIFDKKHIAEAMNENVLALIMNEFVGNGESIIDIAEILHKNDCLFCCDMNNMKNLIGMVRPGDFDADIVYFDIENMFDISNYKGESDSAALGVSAELEKYIPLPIVDIDDEEQYYNDYDKNDSIGKVNDYYGDFASFIKTLSYILSLGYDGLKECSLRKMI